MQRFDDKILLQLAKSQLLEVAYLDADLSDNDKPAHMPTFLFAAATGPA